MKEKVAAHPYGYDARGNIYQNALAESLWALELLNSLSENDQTIYKTLIQAADEDHHVRDELSDELKDEVLPKETEPMRKWFYYTLQNDQWVGRKVRMELNWEFDKKITGGFTEAEEKIHDNLRADSMFAAETRGRQRVSENKRTLSVKDRDAGLVSKQYASPDPRQVKLYDFFPSPVLHEKGSTIRQEVEGGIDEAFKKTGAPFIAGASGSMEYVIYDLRRAVKRGVIREKDIEKWILVATAELILGGHHSLSEGMLVAKNPAFNYFADVSDPRKSYAGFLYEIAGECEKYGFYAKFSSLSHENQVYLIEKGIENLKNIQLISSCGESTSVKELFEQIEKSRKPAVILHVVDKLEKLIAEMTISRRDKRQITAIFDQALPFLGMAQDIQTIAMTGKAMSMIRKVQSFP